MRLKLERIGFLPPSDPWNRKVRACFTKAGFQRVKLELNADRSMLSFWMERGTHPAFKSGRQAHTLMIRLLREAGISLVGDTMSVSLKGDTIDGAFVPPDWRPGPPD